MEVLNTGMGKIEDKIEMKVLENQMLYFWPYSSCDVYFTFSWRCLVNGWRENYRTQTEKERKKEREREGKMYSCCLTLNNVKICYCQKECDGQ